MRARIREFSESGRLLRVEPAVDGKSIAGAPALKDFEGALTNLPGQSFYSFNIPRS